MKNQPRHDPNFLWDFELPKPLKGDKVASRIMIEFKRKPFTCRS